MEDFVMKKQIYSILVALTFLFVSFPAYAGDWYATLEREILVNSNDEQAIENAVKSGIDRDVAFCAAYKIIEKSELGLNGCEAFQTNCCDGSVYTPTVEQCRGWSNSCSCQ